MSVPKCLTSRGRGFYLAHCVLYGRKVDDRLFGDIDKARGACSALVCVRACEALKLAAIQRASDAPFSR